MKALGNLQSDITRQTVDYLLECKVYENMLDNSLDRIFCLNRQPENQTIEELDLRM